jgi:hypothetical protein
MAAARRTREIHELATHRRHRQNLARRQAIRAHQADGEGSNTVDAGWGDGLLQMTVGQGRRCSDGE